ncbi:outer membrane biogenesis protein BamB [Pirellulimonas nuda]|uniref:Outer membrane biogenesis protein BamB n=1 Tax=Pirellulimonas nuda TaxID=2528009 RepID=A0A518DGT6_9BACT|nr:PQQ-binding-like beta-propeller repeat protein [Pirellulimonas nuda]QDU90689.1 outer membrane biogenesis protein BamB [Pirellulimonas nuda]
MIKRYPPSALLRTIAGGLLAFAGCGQGPPVQVVEVTAVAASNDSVKPLEFSAADWPQWRGATIDGATNATGLATQWDASTNIAWKADVPGRGHSSPIVIGDTIYLASAVTGPDRQVVLAYDRATGQKRWETTVHEGGFPSDRQVHQKGSNANGTLASDGERVFATFLNDGKIVATALDTAGKQAWQQELGAFRPKFGYAPSPVLYRSLVIVPADNAGGAFIAALDRESGEIVWRRKRANIDTYSSALLATIAGRDQLVITGGDKLASYDPATGEELWTCQAISEATCGTPITNGTEIFASGGFPARQTVCVAGDGTGETLWSNNTKVYEPSMLLAGGNLFAVTDEGIGWCWDAATGAVKWKQRIGGAFSASPILSGNLVYVPNLSGETVVFEASSEGYHEVARNPLGDDCYASPAVSGSDLFLRVGVGSGDQRKEQLVCIRPAT